MPKLAANISTMFGEWEFPDRIAAAADAGFSAVECQWPYEYKAEKIARELSRHGLNMVLVNAPAGDWASGDVGLAALPGRETACREGIGLALAYCLELGCPQVHLLSGRHSSEYSEGECRKTMITNARFAAELLEPHGIKILFEPINTFDIPYYFNNRTGDVVSLIEETDRQNVGLQYDLYHAYRMGEDLYAALHQHNEIITHIQISGSPGRHEPDVGGIDYPPLLQVLDDMEYDGWVGCEYKPLNGTIEGLGWASSYGIGV